MRIRGAMWLLVLAVTPAAWAQGQKVQAAEESKEQNIYAYVELLRSDMKVKKVAIITELMQFNEQQSTAFWPVYREYDLKLSALGDERLAIIQDYARDFLTMTDQKADQLAGRVMDLDDKKMKLRREYYDKLRKVLPTVLVVRFFQIEHQVQLLVDLQIASGMPIIEESGSN